VTARVKRRRDCNATEYNPTCIWLTFNILLGFNTRTFAGWVFCPRHRLALALHRQLFHRAELVHHQINERRHGQGQVAAAGVDQLQMAPVRNAVHVGMVEFLGGWQQGKQFADYPHLAQAAGAMLDDMAWWATALKTARSAA